MNYSGYFTDKDGNKYYAEPKYNYLKIKGVLASGTSFNDVALSGESNTYIINGALGTNTLSGFPTGAYSFGLLITINPNSRKTSDWSITQIYIPDLPSQNGLYFRTRTSNSWLKLNGTAVNPIT